MPRRTDQEQQRYRFRGFDGPNYTQVPDALFDELLSRLSGAELKVLLYILRRTFGFKKESDAISFNQICSGITTRKGQVLDQGTGLSKSTAQIALKGLIDKNIVVATKRVSAKRGNEPTLYSPNLVTPYAENRHSPPPKIGIGLYRKSAPQETVRQETVEQETVLYSNDQDFKNEEDQSKQGREVVRREGSYKLEVGDGPGSTSRKGSSEPTALKELLKARLAQPVERKGRARAASRTSRKVKAPESIEALMSQWSGMDLHDDAHTASNISQATNILRASGLSEAAFIAKMYEARKKMLEYSGSIKKRSDESPFEKNRAPYFFACLKELLGLTEEQGRASEGAAG
jgi:hypothetical protein